MAVKRSNIGWCDFSGGDANFIIGCTPTSEGCRNCYARNLIERRQGRDFSAVRLYPEKLRRLKKTKFEENGVPFRRGPGSRPIVFPCDLSDLFHPDVPDAFILEAVRVMGQRDDVDWAVLTKRVERLAHFDLASLHDGFPPNVWIGATVENQERADERIPILLKVRAGVHWLSMEPLLEAVDIRRALSCAKPPWNRLSWAVVGAESGAHRRPFDAAWAKRIYEDCRAANVPFFGKQDSGFRPGAPLLIDRQEIKEFPM
jgi:protein gp37